MIKLLARGLAVFASIAGIFATGYLLAGTTNTKNMETAQAAFDAQIASLQRERDASVAEIRAQASATVAQSEANAANRITQAHANLERVTADTASRARTENEAARTDGYDRGYAAATNELESDERQTEFLARLLAIIRSDDASTWASQSFREGIEDALVAAERGDPGGGGSLPSVVAGHGVGSVSIAWAFGSGHSDARVPPST